MSHQLPEALDLQLLSNFIHQLINPLNGVIGTLDNVIEGTVAPERRSQRLRAVRAQLEHSILLVRNLAYFAKVSTLEEANPEYRVESCVIPALIIEGAMFFQEEGLSRKVRIHLVDRQTQYAIDGVKDLLRQVFMNIFDNATKYADPETQVRIETRIQKHTGDLIAEIKSVGKGIKSHEREKIFELGYRGDDAQRHIASGTGLGLYICRRIIEDVHKGGIEAEYSERLREMLIRIRIPKGYVLDRNNAMNRQDT